MSGSINVMGYPSTNRVPGVFTVVDASQANTGTINQRGLLIGQMLIGGTGVAGTAVLSAGVGDAITSFGAGSDAALKVERVRNLDTVGEWWVLPLADAGSAAAATGTIAFTGTAAQNGTIPL